MLSILIFQGVDVSETGILLTVLQTVANTLGSPSPYFIPIIVIFVTCIELIVIIYNIKQISDHGYSGIIVSGTGFFGTILIFGGSMGNVQLFTYVGVGMWITGIVISRFKD